MIVLIRDMTVSDIEYMHEIEKLCFSLPWSKESLLSETENKLAKYFIAESGGRVVGYVGMWIIVGEGHITNVAVHPDFRRLKIGETLIKNLMDYAYKNKIVKVMLEVRVSNMPAQRLYEKFGFYKVYIRKGYYQDNNEDAIIMMAVPKGDYKNG